MTRPEQHVTSEGMRPAGTAVEVLSPCAGTVHPLSEAPDPVFAAEMLGSGVAVDPARVRGPALAPVSGTVVKAHPHAYVIVTGDGTGVLVHLGIDTVDLAGAGFTVLVTERETVTAGQDVVTWDPAAVEAGGLSPLVLVCVLDTAPGAISPDPRRKDVHAGEFLFTWPAQP